MNTTTRSRRGRRVARRRAAPPTISRRGRSKRRAPRHGATPYLFVLPGFALFAVAIAYPIVRAFQISLYDWKVLGAAASDYVGFDNYRRALDDDRFWLGLTNSGIYMAVTVPVQIVLGLAIATLLNRKSPAQPFFRVLYYMPVVTSWVVVSLLFKYLFADDGLVNYGLGTARVTDGETSWLSERWTALLAISALGIWKGIGWSMMIFLAALQGVSRELEEAAYVDGANRWQRFRGVTLPAIWPAMLFVTVMLMIGGFNVFTSVLLMTNGGPGGQTEVVLTYMYRQAFGPSLDFGYASTLAILLAGFVFVLAVAQLRFFRSRPESVG